MMCKHGTQLLDSICDTCERERPPGPREVAAYQAGHDQGYKLGHEHGVREGREAHIEARKATVNRGTNPSKGLLDMAAKRRTDDTPCAACKHGRWLHSDEYEKNPDPERSLSYRGGTLIGKSTGRCTKSGCKCWRFGMSPEEQTRLNEAKEFDDLLADLAGDAKASTQEVMLNYAAQDAAATKQVAKAVTFATLYGGLPEEVAEVIHAHLRPV